MNDKNPAVQVPMSQLVKWQEDLAALLPPGTYAIKQEIASALAQPTPTAEPKREWVAAVLRRAGYTYTDDGPIDELFDLFTGRTVMAETSAGRMPLVDAFVEPPRLEDLAPGAVVRDALGFTWVRRSNGAVADDGEPLNWVGIAAERDDLTGRYEATNGGLEAPVTFLYPSTIRDVTTPKDAA